MTTRTATRQAPAHRPPLFADLPPARAIIEEVDETGAACLTSAVSSEWLDRAREYANGIATAGHETMLEGIDRQGPAFIDELTGSAALADLLDAVAAGTCPLGDPDDRRLSCTIRVVNGPDPAERPLWFHYDATVVTMVIPVTMPDAGVGRSGELILFPSKRPYRQKVIHNVAEKFVSQSNWYRKRLAHRMALGHNARIVALEPGNAYFFWGYRSYHATMPCAPGSTRVTVVIHYRDVHRGSRLLGGAKGLYQRWG